jgi:uncharacterized protein
VTQQKSFEITDVSQIEALIGEPMEFVRAKVGAELNEAMTTFISHSPLVFVATVDGDGHIDVSPKGDPPGFVEVDASGDLLIPERLGNRLTFGFHNILDTGRIGLIFVVPNQVETLRVKGRASLHHDPEVLERMAVKGRAALMYTHVEVQECFFHCGKAMIRSSVWKPETWVGTTRSIAAQQMAGTKKPDAAAVRRTEEMLALSYEHELY